MKMSNEPLKENTEIFNPSNLSYRYGIIGGLLTSAILIFMNSGEATHPIYFSIFKYIPMALMVILALNEVMKIGEDKAIFSKGASIAFKLSLIAGILVALVSVILFAVNPEWAFNKFGQMTTTYSRAILVGAMLFFEILVLTNLIAFIMLQYIKRDVKI